ncbi:proto-oncogene serine/threonine-protein kinase mos [Drosophila madeirensis]|uniref:Proto-oncogene serine/threonine-protein kinase mos n=1 Tax=Drosophila madeirensis TaxID=30013 RepID=A0AAU9G8T2_DROMD
MFSAFVPCTIRIFPTVWQRTYTEHTQLLKRKHRYTVKMSFSVANRENELVLTTPKRNELLKDGPPVRTRCQVLGRGAYGTVFKAIYRDHSVAVKIIKGQAVSTLHNESHLLNLEHKNIVRLIKTESAVAFGMVIMECPKGQCLQQILETLALPLFHRVLITLDIVAALRYCHWNKLLHLDVKPTNILVALGPRPSSMGHHSCYQRSYICKLCDFGSSIKIGEYCARQSQNNGRGTLRYMSPEALRSDPLSDASDIYSLAITMWQMQSRRLPYHTLTCNESIAYQVVKHELRPDNYEKLKALSVDYPKRAPLVGCNWLYVNESSSQAMSGGDLCRRANMLACRNLNFETTCSSRSREIKKKRRQNRLALYFDSPAPHASTSTCLESSYTDLYRSCWVSVPELRTNSFLLRNKLELILSRSSPAGLLLGGSDRDCVRL